MTMNPKIFDYFATTAQGMEPLLAIELKEIGAENISLVKAGVSFKGPLSIGYKSCLHSRIANRVLLVLKTIKAADADELYEGIQSIDWLSHIAPEKTLAVDFLLSHSRNNRNLAITHTHFGALKVKDAIVDQIRAQKGQRPSINSINPDVRVNVHLFDTTATVSIDLSGESLHRRGYRQEGTPAPLKENLAAAILMNADWHKKEGFDLIDPMCGSGTILIEGCLMAKNIAPGLLRHYFGFLGWEGHDALLWQRLKEEAESAIKKGRKKFPKIIGYDKDAQAVGVALSNIEKAGLSGFIECRVGELKNCKPEGEKGMLVVNPPYGERLGDTERLKYLYKELGDVMKQRFKGWEGYVFTGNPELAKSIGLKASRRFVLFNGPIECRLLKFDLY